MAHKPFGGDFSRAYLATMDTDQLQGLAAFIRAVEGGSFAAAARMGNTTPSAVSKSISRLEKRLDVRLFQRTTRTTTLTEEGQRYYDEVAPLVSALGDAEDVLNPKRPPSGRLRVSLPVDIGRDLLQGITRDFIPRHPEIKLDISLSDRRADVLREGFDLALRLGPLEDSSLFSRPLGIVDCAMVASPSYLAKRGEPSSIADLARHSHIGYQLDGRPYPIRFADGQSFQPDPVMAADSGEALRIAATNGLGIALLVMPSIRKDLASGTLVRVLPDLELRSVPANFIHAFERSVPRRATYFMDFVAGTFE